VCVCVCARAQGSSLHRRCCCCAVIYIGTHRLTHARRVEKYKLIKTLAHGRCCVHMCACVGVCVCWWVRAHVRVRPWTSSIGAASTNSFTSSYSGFLCIIYRYVSYIPIQSFFFIVYYPIFYFSLTDRVGFCIFIVLLGTVCITLYDVIYYYNVYRVARRDARHTTTRNRKIWYNKYDVTVEGIVTIIFIYNSKRRELKIPSMIVTHAYLITMLFWVLKFDILSAYYFIYTINLYACTSPTQLIQCHHKGYNSYTYIILYAFRKDVRRLVFVFGTIKPI